jgi:hypothetical protein
VLAGTHACDASYAHISPPPLPTVLTQLLHYQLCLHCYCSCYYRNGWFATDRHGLCDAFRNRGGSTFDPKLELAKVECADKSSDFKDIYAKYSANFLKGDDSFFKSQFCLAYQAMGTIGEYFTSFRMPLLL